MSPKGSCVKSLAAGMMSLWCGSNFKGLSGGCHITGVTPPEVDSGTMNPVIPFPLSFVRNKGRDFIESFMYFSMICGFTSGPKQ